MATDEENYEDENAEDSNGGPPRKYVRDLEKKAKALEAQVAEFSRKEAVRAAGLVDLNERQLKAVLATHEGELTPDSLTQIATELGFVQEKPEVDPEVRSGHERVAAASTGAAEGSQISKDDEYASARTPAEVLAIAQKHGSPTTVDV